MHRILLALTVASACTAERTPDSRPSPSPVPVVEPSLAPVVEPPRDALTRPSGRRVIPRSELESWSGLPPRAIFTVQMGLSGQGPVQRQILIDLDTRRIEAVDYGFTVRPPAPLKRALDAQELTGIQALAEDAWRAPPPQLDQVTDYREVVIITDGDDAYMFSAHSPIGGDSPVARVVTELRRLARWQR